MGDIAEDMIRGIQCSWCGIYFEAEHGYPVACKACWKEAMKDWRNRQEFKRTETIGGVQPSTEKEL